MINSSIYLSIIIPAYKEEENLRNILPRLIQTVENIDSEIIIVDTIKPLDSTKELCNQYKCLYITRKHKNYFGNAVREGIKKAQGKFIIFMDADGSHMPEFIPNLLQHANSYDIVIASRYVDKGYTDNNVLLRFMSKILNISFSLVLGLPCKDVSNSFKLYHSEQLKKITLICNNFDIVEEIIFKVYKNNKNCNIKEVPFIFKQRMFGKSKRKLFIFILTYLYTIIKLRLMIYKL